MKKKLVAGILIAVAIGFAGIKVFSKGNSKMGQMPPPVVKTATVQEGEIIDKIKINGRIEAINTVDITARVEGYLQKRYFEEGAFVKKGDPLFLIEPDRYKIGVQSAGAQIDNAKAALDEAEKNLKRTEELLKLDYISKAQYDDALAKRDMAKAALKSTYASLNQANLNLNYTKIYSPISGKIGRINITEGNAVSPSSGPIARIVSLDPIYVKTGIRSELYVKLKKASEKDMNNMDVEIELCDGSKYPLKGTIDFYDNQIDPSTGVIDLRATFKNPDNLLVPGQYLVVTMSSKTPRKVVLIPQESVIESAQGKIVYVLNKDNTANPVPVKVNGENNGSWIVEDGLKIGETVVTEGVQKVRPGSKVMVAPAEKPSAPEKVQKTGGR